MNNMNMNVPGPGPFHHVVPPPPPLQVQQQQQQQQLLLQQQQQQQQSPQGYMNNPGQVQQQQLQQLQHPSGMNMNMGMGVGVGGPPQLQAQQQQAGGGQPHGASSETVLRIDANIPNMLNLTYEEAYNILTQGIRMSSGRPYRHEYIDKPKDGDMHVIFQPVSALPLPVDGVRYLEQEQRYSIPLGEQVVMEVIESKYGFVPGSNEPSASRVRKKFRLAKGGHPNVWLIHYSRGPSCVIPPQVANMPVRNYPLVPSNEPAVFVMGDKAGQKVYPNMPMHGHSHPSQHPAQPPQQQPHGGQFHPHGAGVQGQVAAVAAQNANMAAMNAMNGRMRSHAPTSQKMPAAPMAGQRRQFEEEIPEDAAALSHRELATLRFTHNHEFLADLFNVDMPASPPPAAQTIFNDSKEELEAKLAKLNEEIEALNRKLEDVTKPKEESVELTPGLVA